MSDSFVNMFCDWDNKFLFRDTSLNFILSSVLVSSFIPFLEGVFFIWFVALCLVAEAFWLERLALKFLRLLSE